MQKFITYSKNTKGEFKAITFTIPYRSNISFSTAKTFSRGK